MSRSALTAVVFAALMLLAGCNFLGTGPSMQTPRVTPASVPTDSPTVTLPEQFVPGLTKDGLTNANALIDAHTDFLANTSFTVRWVWILKFPNRTVAARRVSTVHVDSDRIHSVYNSTGLPAPAHQEFWFGKNRSLTMISNNTSVSYHRLSRSGPSHVEAIPEPEFHGAFEPERDPVVERLSQNGTTLYYLENTLPDNPNTTVSVRIDARGFIRSYSVAKPISYNSVPNATRLVSSMQITDISTTTVERPAWYAEAVNQTPVNRTTATATSYINISKTDL